MSVDNTIKKAYSKGFQSANFPIDDEGRTYHVGTKPGEVANRIITVGDHYRAFQIAEYFDNVTKEDLEIAESGGPYIIRKPNIFICLSKRKFLTITGTYNGIPVSVVAICMGLPMIDFFVRETRHVVKGKIAIIRFGSCGTIRKNLETGSVAVATGAFMISRNYNYFKTRGKRTNDKNNEQSSAYHLSEVCYADNELSKLIYKNLKKECERKDDTLEEIKVEQGLNGSADSFYGSQGRIDSDFIDDNEDLLKRISKKYKDCISIEMETFGLFHLAECYKTNYNNNILKEKDSDDEKPSSKRIKLDNENDDSIKTGAVAMIFANRVDNSFISNKKIFGLQSRVIKTLLNSLTTMDLGKNVHPTEGSVWEEMLKNSAN